MFKKILIGGLLLGLIGVLVAGAVMRTTSVTSAAQAHGHGYGRNSEINAEAHLTGQGSGGRWGQGNAQNPAAPAGAGLAQANDWLTIEGLVQSVDANALVVKTASGEQVTVENRSWWFAQEQGFSAQAGDRVMLQGFYEGDDFETVSITNLTSGQSASLREAGGRPLWAGRGRRGW